MATTKNTKSTTKSTPKASKAARRPSFWDAETDGTFTCEAGCARALPVASFQTVTIWEDGTRTRQRECRNCRDQRLGKRKAAASS